MSSVQLIRKIRNTRRSRLNNETILKTIKEMPELESYRVLVWLCCGLKAWRSKKCRDLVEYLSRDEPFYQKVLNYLTGRCPADQINGFTDYRGLLDSTLELVSLVV